MDNRYNRNELLELLLDKNASLFSRIVALKKLYPDIYEEFDLEIDIDAKNEYNRTALMITCEHWHTKVAELLIEAGADINAKDYFGTSPLMFACMYNSDTIVNLLIKAGADINAQDNDGDTALMKAAYNFDDRVDIVKALISAGADVNIKNKLGQTALAYASRMNAFSVMLELVKAGADIKPGEFMYEKLLEYMKIHNEKGGETK